MAKEFYESKPVAQAALGRLFDGGDPRILTGDTQFEPNKGWVVVLLIPADADGADLEANGFEVQHHGAKPGASKGRSASKALSPSGSSPGPSTAPVKGSTAKVWAIADTYYVEKSAVDRKAIIGLCEAAGIHPATAATQYSKWKRTRGL